MANTTDEDISLATEVYILGQDSVRPLLHLTEDRNKESVVLTSQCASEIRYLLAQVVQPFDEHVRSACHCSGSRRSIGMW